MGLLKSSPTPRNAPFWTDIILTRYAIASTSCVGFSNLSVAENIKDSLEVKTSFRKTTETDK